MNSLHIQNNGLLVIGSQESLWTKKDVYDFSGYIVQGERGITQPLFLQ